MQIFFDSLKSRIVGHSNIVKVKQYQGLNFSIKVKIVNKVSQRSLRTNETSIRYGYPLTSYSSTYGRSRGECSERIRDVGRVQDSNSHTTLPYSSTNDKSSNVGLFSRISDHNASVAYEGGTHGGGSFNITSDCISLPQARHSGVPRCGSSPLDPPGSSRRGPAPPLENTKLKGNYV